jgi:hypothetical protein
VFAPGDEIAILVSNKGKTPVFVELVGTGTKGEKVILIPAGNSIAPGAQLRFPETSTIKVKAALGQELITVFASNAKFSPGVLYHGKNVADRYVHQYEALNAIVKKSLIIETR